jgi:hypothetical protein
MTQALFLTLLCSFISLSLRAEELVKSKVASIYISENFINEQLGTHLAKSDLIRKLKMKLDSKTNKMFLHGEFQLPLDDIRAIGIERHLAEFKFQLSILPKISPLGHLVLEFPISETYFYQANSKNPRRDRVVIPVQLLSLGLAATRGYLAALSGDFSTFDRKAAKLRALLSIVKRSLITEKNLDVVEVLVTEKKSLELQLASIDLERVQFKRTAKTLNSIFAFTGEKEFNLNNEIEARQNAVMLKLKLNKLVPYLQDIELGGIRTANNKPNAEGENYLVLDIDTLLTKAAPQETKPPYRSNTESKVAPSLVIRLNQSLFTSKMIVDKEKEKMSSDIKDFQILFQDDGIHISGTLHKYFMKVPFDGLVDFVSTGPDIFEVRLRALEVLRMDFKFLTPLALRAIKSRLKKALNGVCTFKYLGKKDQSRVLQVRIEPKNLIPAFPDFHLVDVDVRERNFMLKIGRIN